jgi:energy-coupling factor transporter transmembrane protein EcfT
VRAPQKKNSCMQRNEILRINQRVRIFFFVVFVTVPLVFFIVYFDCFLSLVILNEYSFSGFASVFKQPLWKLILLAFIQYCASTIIISYFIGLGKVILRNRQFLFGSGAACS